ncbi:hypothetical protein ACQPZX_02720 [Actinoplanes sp. CA-142083]|uniref:hypothetical protein n=1 Tax=Actinoplanes sp. CA-142083 TaxID=3239903 RepID=UPI003D8DAC1A
MRCVVSTSRSEGLDGLLRIINDHGFDPILTEDMGAGSSLMSADFSDVTCAVAVLPEIDEAEHQATGLLAIYVEIGILLGKGIPLLAITGSRGGLHPALSSVAYAAVDLEDDDSLAFHLRMFLKTLSVRDATSAEIISREPAAQRVDLDATATSILETLDAGDRGSALQFEKQVVRLLSEVFGGVADNVDRAGGQDLGVDAVIGVEAKHGSPFFVVVEVKKVRGDRLTFRRALEQLAFYRQSLHADLGLLVFDSVGPPQPLWMVEPVEGILALSAVELIRMVAEGSLEQFLRRARNQAVHGA